jgi:hypothetical protein
MIRRELNHLFGHSSWGQLTDRLEDSSKCSLPFIIRVDFAFKVVVNPSSCGTPEVIVVSYRSDSRTLINSVVFYAVKLSGYQMIKLFTDWQSSLSKLLGFKLQ